MIEAITAFVKESDSLRYKIFILLILCFTWLATLVIGVQAIGRNISENFVSGAIFGSLSSIMGVAGVYFFKGREELARSKEDQICDNNNKDSSG